MKKYIILVLAIILIIPMDVYAGRGCCSHHGGQSYCSSDGRWVCNDGTYSPTCRCSSGISSQSVYKDKTNYENNTEQEIVNNIDNEPEEEINSTSNTEQKIFLNNDSIDDSTEETEEDSNSIINLLGGTAIGAGAVYFYNKLKK